MTNVKTLQTLFKKVLAPAGIFFLCAHLLSSEETEELIIVSPHWEGIQYEFGRAFEKHAAETLNKKVTVRWRDLGGTSKIEKALDANYKANPETVGVDLFFGGGIDPFENQKRKNHLQACSLPEEIISRIPPSVGGFDLIDKDFMYYGAALSSFGILENRRVIEAVGLPAVETWEDLAQPELLGWVSSSDPRQSGSVHMIYEIILQAYGWEKAWEVIYQFSGNVKQFEQSSSAPTKQVSVGDVAYAVSIDINGMTQQAFLGKENVRFKIPAGVSVINPDGIAMMKGAPNEELAREFIQFVMSEKGQKLWMVSTGQPGGAEKFGITRMGVLPHLYEGDMSQLLVPLNPFEVDYPFQYDSEKGSSRWGIVNDLIGQTVIDVHSHLVRAWKAIIRLDPVRRSDLVAEFSRPLVSEEEAFALADVWKNDKVQAGRLRNDWMRRAVERYHQLERKAKERLNP